MRSNQAVFTLLPKRGEITGRNGWILARDIPTSALYVDPSKLDNIEELVTNIAPLLDVDPKILAARLSEAKLADRKFAWLARQVDREKALLIAHKSKDIQIVKDTKRVYPYSQLSAHLLGFVGIDNYGLSGLERSFEESLKGEAQVRLVSRDAHYRSWDYFPRTLIIFLPQYKSL